jgi:hypothetical protein
VGSPGSLGYREIFSVYREIFQKSEFFEKFWQFGQSKKKLKKNLKN